MGIVEGKGKMRLTKKRADNGRYYLSGLAEVLNSYPKGYGLIQVGHAVDKLAEYEDLEEQNKLLKLPCAVGDTVYYRYDGIKIAPMYVEKIIIAKYGVNLLLSYCGNDEELKYWTIDIESTAIDCGIVFLTREEAESALKDREIKLKDRIKL